MALQNPIAIHTNNPSPCPPPHTPQSYLNIVVDLPGQHFGPIIAVGVVKAIYAMHGLPCLPIQTKAHSDIIDEYRQHWCRRAQQLSVRHFATSGRTKTSVALLNNRSQVLIAGFCIFNIQCLPVYVAMGLESAGAIAVLGCVRGLATLWRCFDPTFGCVRCHLVEQIRHVLICTFHRRFVQSHLHIALHPGYNFLFKRLEKFLPILSSLLSCENVNNSPRHCNCTAQSWCRHIQE